MEAALRLDRELPSTLSSIEPVCVELKALLEAARLGDRARFAVELLARECLSNAILHGNQGRAGALVALSVRLGPRWVRLRVGDQGPGFDWRRAMRAAAAAIGPPEATSGRGLCIAALYANRVQFNRRGSQITLWLRRDAR